MYTLTVISGSPRKGGNTDMLLDSAIEAAKQNCCAVSKIILNDLNIKPCQDCNGCAQSGKCVIDDDMVFIYGRLEKSDIILVGSPLYFGSVSAQVKLMVDRMQCAWVKKYKLKATSQGRRVGGAIICGAREENRYYECASSVIDIFYRVQDVKYAEKLFVKKADVAGQVLKSGRELDNASRLITSLIKKYEDQQ